VTHCKRLLQANIPVIHARARHNCRATISEITGRRDREARCIEPEHPVVADVVCKAIAAAASSISGRAGERTGRSSSSIGLGLIEAGAAHTRGLGGGIDLLYEVIDGHLDRP